MAKYTYNKTERSLLGLFIFVIVLEFGFLNYNKYTKSSKLEEKNTDVNHLKI